MPKQIEKLTVAEPELNRKDPLRSESKKKWVKSFQNSVDFCSALIWCKRSTKKGPRFG